MDRFTDSMLHIRVKYKTGNGYVVNVTTVATMSWLKKDNYYSHKGWYGCDYFEINENVGGDIFITTYKKMKHSGVTYTNKIKLNRGEVEEMRIDTIANY